MALDHVTPNATLARELQEVAKEAERVAETVRGLNLVPRNFPVEALTEMCISLANLKNGTAEGCIEPLNFARYMLPLVRRDHFHIEGEEPKLDDDEDTYFTREHALDQAITRLYAAVGTALDEYRAQAQDKYDDHVGAEEIIELGEDNTFAEISHKSQNLAQNATAERQNLLEMANPDSANVENLSRQFQDSANIAHSIQSQIRIRPVVARWYESAGQSLRKLPDVMIRTANMLRLGADIGQIWHNEWSAFNKRIRNAVYDQVRGLADALQATGERLKQGRRPMKTSVGRQRDPEAIAAEKRVKELLLSGTALPVELAQGVEFLAFRVGEGKIGRPADLTLLKNVRGLKLGDCLSRIEDVSAVAQLSNLTSLSIYANNASDIAALGQLSNLTNLSVHANSASDIAALGQLSNLTNLTVSANSASDIAALGQLSNLTRLMLESHGVTDISALGQISNLTNLTLQIRSIRDISALGRLSNLTSLSVHASNIRDISALERLSNLTSLTLHANKLRDISALAQLSNLTSLSIYANSILDISALGRLSNLTSLSVHASNIRDISALGQISNLARLSLEASNVSEISALGRLSNLTSLSLKANVRDVSALVRLPNLTDLAVNAKNTNIFGIIQMEKLTEISIVDAKSLNLAPFSKMANLKKIILSNSTFRNLALLKSINVILIGNSREV